MNDILSAPLWQKAIAVILIFAVATWGYYNFLYKPKVDKINNLKKELASIDLELKLIMPPETVLQKGVDIREVIKKELDELMKKIPTEAEVPYIIKNLISEVGKGLNIDYNLIRPEPVKPEDKYKRLPLNVDFLSDYTDLNLYLSELKKLPTTIRIDSLDLNRTVSPPKIQVKMAMSAFVMPGRPAKESPILLEKRYYLYDPFFELKTEKEEVKKTEKKEPYELTGIWFGKAVKAIINNKLVGVGEKINGFTVTKITSEEVILKKGEVTQTLKIRR